MGHRVSPQREDDRYRASHTSVPWSAGVEVCSEETFTLSAMLTDKEGMGEEEGDSE